MTRTVFYYAESGVATAGGQMPLFSGNATTTGTLPTPVMLRAGTLANLRIWWITANSAGQSRIFTLKKNGSTVGTYTDAGVGATSLVQAGTLTTVTASDKIYLVQTSTGSPTAIALWITFDFDSDDDSTVYGFGHGAALSATATNYISPLGGWKNLSSFPVVANAPGTVQEWTAVVESVPGVGKSWTGVLLLNGVAQDGTGGTPNTTITISGGSATEATSGAFSLSVAKLDTLESRFTPSGTPTAGWVGCMMAWQPINAGDLFVATSPIDPLSSGSVTEFVAPYGTRDWVTTESGTSGAALRGGDTDLLLQHLYVRLSSALTTGQGWTFTLRKNGADTALTVSLGDGDQEVTFSGDDTVTISAGDYWCIKAVGSSAPSNITARVSFLATEAVIRGSFAFGEKGTWKKSRVTIFSLDGNTNIVDEENTFQVNADRINTTGWPDIEHVTGADGMIQRGLRSAQPAVADVVIGTLYYVTDENVTERSNGTTWEDFTDAGGSGGALDDLSDVIITTPATNDVLQYDGSDWVNGPSPGVGGALAMLEEHIASASSQLDFTTAITAAYDQYLILGDGLVLSTSTADLQIQIGTGGGPTYDTGNNYEWTSHGRSTAGTDENDNGSTGIARVFKSMGTTAGWSGSFMLNAYSLRSTSLRKTINGDTYFINSTPRAISSRFGMQWTTTGTAVSALRFKPSAGTITSGVIRIYGISSV